MKLLLPLFLILGIANNTNCQNNKADTSVDIGCGFIEFDASLKKHVWERFVKQVTHNDSIQKAGNIPSGIYVVDMAFVISKTGIITQPVTKNDPGYGLAEYVKDKLLTSNLKWDPALQNGRVVKSYQRRQFVFKIGEACKNVPDMQYL